MNNRNMRHFLYLDHDLVDSIIAQENKGLITGVSENTGIKHEEKSSSKFDSHVSPEINAGLAKILSGKISAGLDGEMASGTELIASDSKVITKILHDAAFDIAFNAINPKVVTDSDSSITYGDYLLIKREFTIVDFDELESLLGENGLLDYKKSLDASALEQAVTDRVSELSATLSKDKLKSANSKLRNEMNKLIKQNNKQYDDIAQVVSLLRLIIPYDRMLVSNDGYMVPMDDHYFRTNVKNMGLKYGGELTCVGLITNIIGEDKSDESNIFSTLQSSINSALISVLPTKEKTLNVVQPIAIYYE